MQDLFGSHADRYDARHYGSRHRTFFSDRLDLVHRVLSCLKLRPGARVLDVACGPGHFLRVAAASGVQVTGIDSSRAMLCTSAARLGPAARLVAGDAVALPFASGSFDVLNCSGLIEYFPDSRPLLWEFRRVVRPGGTVMVSSTNRRSPALALDSIVEATRRNRVLRALVRAVGLPADEVSLRERRFRMTFHAPQELASLLESVGFEGVRIEYCHLQLLPHPLDHVVPALTTAVVRLTDRLLPMDPFRRIAEGLLAVARCPR